MENKDLKAVCALIINEDNKILSVSRRDDHNDWGLPGGKVDSDETLEQALHRECLEETGYKVEIDFNENPFDSYDGSVFTRTYLCTILNPEKPFEVNEKEGLIEFKEPEDLLKGSFGKYNLKCFARFNSKVFYTPKEIAGEG